MKRLTYAAYVWCIVIGAYMLLFTPNGVLKICIACNSVLTNLIAVVSIVIGAAGIFKTAGSKTMA